MTCFNILGSLVGERMHTFHLGDLRTGLILKDHTGQLKVRRYCLNAGAETYCHIYSMLSFSLLWSLITWVLEPFLFTRYHKCLF